MLLLKLSESSLKVSEVSHSIMSKSLWLHGLWPLRLLHSWYFLGKNTGMGFHFLLQGIFLTQGLNPHLLHCQADSFPLSHQGSPIMAFGLPILREENSSSTFTEIFSAQIFSYVKVAFKMLLRWLLGHWPILLIGTYQSYWASLVAQRVKHLPTMWETWVQSLGQEDPLEKGIATHSSILAWRIPWSEEPGRLQSMGSQRVGHDWLTHTHQSALLSSNALKAQAILFIAAFLI